MLCKLCARNLRRRQDELVWLRVAERAYELVCAACRDWVLSVGRRSA